MHDPMSHGVTYIDQKPRSVSNPDPSRIVAIPFKLRQGCEVVGIGTRMPNIARASAIFWFETRKSGSLSLIYPLITLSGGALIMRTRLKSSTRISGTICCKCSGRPSRRLR